MTKHLSFEDRNLIAQHLNEGCSFKAITKELGKNCTSISREVRNHLVFKQAGAPGRSFNACKHRFSCKKFHICSECSHKRFSSFCKTCKLCNHVCSDFEAEVCQKLLAPPYVCNGCPKHNTSCTLERLTRKALLREITNLSVCSCQKEPLWMIIPMALS